METRLGSTQFKKSERRKLINSFLYSKTTPNSKMSEIINSIQVSDDVNRFVDHSFEVVNKIHSILENQGKTQKDLSVLLGKSESEISKWMRGTHNFTLKSIAKIEAVLGEKILTIKKEDKKTLHLTSHGPKVGF